MGFFDGIIDTVVDFGKDIIGGGVKDAASSAIGGAVNSWFDENALKKQNEFNAEQAGIARDFNAGQAQIARDFNASEAGKTRDFNANQASLAREWAAAQASQAMDFSKEMSNTQFQRGVADMKAAGLNPMLAVSKGGASSPTGLVGASSAASAGSASGPSASTSAASAASRRFPSESIASAMQALQLAQQAARTRAETENIKADTLVKRAEAESAHDYFRERAFSEHAKSYKTGVEGEAVARQNEAGRWEAEVQKVNSEIRKNRASAQDIESSNIAIKELMANPVTKPFAAILQLILKGR